MINCIHGLVHHICNLKFNLKTGLLNEFVIVCILTDWLNNILKGVAKSITIIYTFYLNVLLVWFYVKNIKNTEVQSLSDTSYIYNSLLFSEGNYD